MTAKEMSELYARIVALENYCIKLEKRVQELENFKRDAQIVVDIHKPIGGPTL